MRKTPKLSGSTGLEIQIWIIEYRVRLVVTPSLIVVTAFVISLRAPITWAKNRANFNPIGTQELRCANTVTLFN